MINVMSDQDMRVSLVLSGVDPHPSPLPSSREREPVRVMSSLSATPLDVNTPSPGSTGEGWGEGLCRGEGSR
jgi:hypothetical protein